MTVAQLSRRIVQGVMRRRKRLALITIMIAAAVLLPVAYWVSKEPPRFTSSAVILLEARPDRVPIFREFSPFRPLPVQIAILRSRTLAESVVDGLPKSSFQDLVENPYYIDYQQLGRNAWLRYRGREPEVESPQSRALKELRQARVDFKLSNAGIVTISATASKPQVAVDIVNAYIEALVARTRSFNVDDARVTREFLEQQLGDVKRSLTTSEQSVRAFVAAHGGVKIPERSRTTMAQLTQTETALAEVAANRKMLQARLEPLRAKVESQKKTPPAPAAPAPAPPPPPSADIQRLRALLTKLESTLLDLRTKFTDEHPRVTLIRSRIEEVRAQLGDAVKDTVPHTPIPGAVPPEERVNFAEQLVAVEASAHAVAAQEAALTKQLETLRASLKGLSSGEMEYGRLLRETEANQNLHSVLAEKLAGARIREQGEMKVVKVIDPASPAVPTASEKVLTALAGALGVALAAGLAVPAGVEWFQRKVETEHDVESTTGLPVLAVIPRLRSRRPIFGTTFDAQARKPAPEFMFTEAFRSLRIPVQLAMRTDNLRTVLVTSPGASDGKSAVVMNLGLALNEAGIQVLLADADFQRPTLHRTMKVKNTGGFMKALQSSVSVEQAITPVTPGMWLMPRGDASHPAPQSLLSGPQLRPLLTEMSTRADLVICDSSPVLLVGDNLFLASAVDAVILVAKVGVTGCRELARAKAMLEAAGGKVMGVVMNEMPVNVLKRHYTSYYTAYGRKTAS